MSLEVVWDGTHRGNDSDLLCVSAPRKVYRDIELSPSEVQAMRDPASVRITARQKAGRHAGRATEAVRAAFPHVLQEWRTTSELFAAIPGATRTAVSNELNRLAHAGLVLKDRDRNLNLVYRLKKKC